MISTSETASVYWQKARRHKIYSYPSLIGVVGFTEWALHSKPNNDANLIFPLIGVAISYATVLGF